MTRPFGSLLSTACLLLLIATGRSAVADPVEWVNLSIGTGDGTVGYGRTMPLVEPPFGMTGWTPQTRQSRQGRNSYKYEDTAITGFIGTHQPAMWMGDYGYVTLIPEIGDLKTTPEARALPFVHGDETAHPDFYSVSMDAGQGRRIRAEMTATTRCAYLRFTFPAGAEPRVVLEASRPGVPGSARFDPARREIVGYNPDRIDANLGPFPLPHFRGYFVVQFRQTPADAGTYPAHPDPASATGAWVRFPADGSRTIDVRVGTSFVSIEQARRNLGTEIPRWNFERTRAALRAAWNRKLSRITVEGASDDQRRIFYTAMYHALLYPRTFSEQGRYYSAFDDTVHRGISYTDYSIWDIFRAEFSYLTLVAPERIDGMITALLEDYREGGWMPKWPNPSYTNIMISTHADSLVAEAIRAGFHGFDRQLVWQAVYKDAMTPPDGDTTRRWYDREPHTPYEARAGLTYDRQLGFIPDDRTAESASRTLGDAYDDWCVAQVALALGRTDDARFFLRRSGNYRHIYDAATGFMRARNSDGSWADPGNGWTEGDAWIYTWDVLHDIPGLVQMLGGRQAFDARLDAYFAGRHNRHGNEPSHHVGYLYDFGGEPWKTQSVVRRLAAAEYLNEPGGLDGDDDCGQMSAWYIFTALGFYPVNPASGEFMIGSPLFSRASLRLGGGRVFTVVADGNSARNLYIQSATLDGRPLDVPVLRLEDITRGATLRLTMGPRPSRWGSGYDPKPLP